MFTLVAAIGLGVMASALIYASHDGYGNSGNDRPYDRVLEVKRIESLGKLEPKSKVSQSSEGDDFGGIGLASPSRASGRVEWQTTISSENLAQNIKEDVRSLLISQNYKTEDDRWSIFDLDQAGLRCKNVKVCLSIKDNAKNSLASQFCCDVLLHFGTTKNGSGLMAEFKCGPDRLCQILGVERSKDSPSVSRQTLCRNDSEPEICGPIDDPVKLAEEVGHIASAFGFVMIASSEIVIGAIRRESSVPAPLFVLRKFGNQIVVQTHDDAKKSRYDESDITRSDIRKMRDFVLPAISKILHLEIALESSLC